MDWCRHWSLDFSVRILNPALWATLGCSPFSSHPACILGTRCVRDFLLLLVTLFWVVPASRSFTLSGLQIPFGHVRQRIHRVWGLGGGHLWEGGVILPATIP